MTQTHDSEPADRSPDECAFGPLLSPFHDGELPADRRAEVAAHVGGCPTCSAELADIRRFSAELTSAPRAIPAAGFAGRMEDAVAAAAAPEPIRLPTGPRFIRTVRWLSAAAAVVGLLALGQVVFRQANVVDPNTGQPRVAPAGDDGTPKPSTRPTKPTEPAPRSMHQSADSTRQSV